MCTPQADVLWSLTGVILGEWCGCVCDMTAMEGRCSDAVRGCNDADELGELVHVVRSAPRRQLLVGHVIDIVPPIRL